jgi:GH24 family phage-related lysozyme (muramidase)
MNESNSEKNTNLDIKKETERWTKVESRKVSSRKKLPSQEQKIIPIKKYWNGFNEFGKELWYIELNNGVIISDLNKEYDMWFKKYYI